MKMSRMPDPVLIFVRPQAAGNVGAIARAMSNFGARELRLVGEGVVYAHRENDPFSKMDWAMAKRGEEILNQSRWFPTFEEALADIELVLGSSGRSVEFEKGYGRPFCSPGQAWAQVSDWTKRSHSQLRWALVIGPEDDGLNEREASLCHQLIRVPTSGPNASLNAAMAVGCLLYHWNLVNEGLLPVEALAEGSGPFPSPLKSKVSEAGRGSWASLQHKERFLDYLMETLAKTSFLKFPDTEAVRARIRRWVQMAPVPLGELLFAFELVYHLRSWGSGKFEERNFLNEPAEKIPSS